MAKSKTTSSDQEQLELLATTVACADVTSLPIILKDPAGHVEMLAPGSVYQPLLLEDHTRDVAPGRLDKREVQFVRDLITWVHPDGSHPQHAGTPLKWGHRDIWFKRNISNAKGAFRLRADDSDWFYPDFIVWILDHARKEQVFGFVDPKGLLQGLGNGWSDYKMVSTVYMPHVVAQHLAETGGGGVRWQGDDWSFRVRGAIVSTTSYDDLKGHMSKFEVFASGGTLVTPPKEAFRASRIVFQSPKDNSYIGDVLDLLVNDTPLDRQMARLADLAANPDGAVEGQCQDDGYLRHRLASAPSMRSVVANVVRDNLLRFTT